MPDLDGLVDRLSSLTVIEAAELAKMLEEQWGVSAAAPVVAPATTGPAPAEAAQEVSEFDVILTSFGTKKVQVVKAVRNMISGLGLQEAMALVTNAPKTIKEAISKTEADSIRESIEAAGGTIEIKPSV